VLIGLVKSLSSLEKSRTGSYRLVSLTSVPMKVKAQIILKTASKYMKDKKVTGNSQHGFTKRKPHLTNLIAFYEKNY